MEEHIGQYLDLTGKPLGTRTDQTTESAHQKLNKRIVRSQYQMKDIESETHGLKLYRAVLHSNAYSL